MAGPSVVVRVLGDLRGLGQSLDGAGAKAAGAASKAQKAFGSFIGGLNRAGVLGPFGGMLDQINEGIGQVISHGKQIGPAMMGAGAAITGVGATLSAFGSKEQASHKQLQAAISATGHAYDDYGKSIEGAIKHGENLAFSSKDTQDALSKLTVATNDPAKALQFLGTAMDVARFKHIDLASAATQVGKVYNGNTKLLKEFGITATKTASYQKVLAADSKASESADRRLGDAKKRLADMEAIDGTRKKLSVSQSIALRNAEDKVRAASLISAAAHKTLADAHAHAGDAARNQTRIMGELATKTHGQASAAVDTFAGKMDVLKTKIEDSISQFGQKYGPALQGAGVAIMAFGTIAETAGAMAGTGEGLALGPILLIIAAVAAVVVAGYVLYRNWSTIWGGIKAVISGVWNWIKTNWPLLLAVLTGPIGIAVLLITRYWNNIRNGAAALLSWLQSAWNAMIGFFAGVVARIGGTLSHIFDTAKSAAGGVLGALQSAWAGVTSWISGLPAQIARLTVNMWHGFGDAFRAVLNTIINLWNSMPHFKMPSFDTHIPGVGKIGGFDVGLPHIQPLATGGYVTNPGLFYLHAGEAVTPKGGATFSIEHVHLHDGLDVDTFLRRAAWAMQTSRV